MFAFVVQTVTLFTAVAQINYDSFSQLDCADSGDRWALTAVWPHYISVQLCAAHYIAVSFKKTKLIAWNNASLEKLTIFKQIIQYEKM